MGEKRGKQEREKRTWPQGLTQTEQKQLFGKWLCLRKNTNSCPLPTFLVQTVE